MTKLEEGLKCHDCGETKPVTFIGQKGRLQFWLCKDCIKSRLNKIEKQ
jgi:transposase-like protein